MAKLVDYRENRRGLVKLRASREVDEMLERRADRVAAVAQAGYTAALAGSPITPVVEVLQVDSDTNEPRARVAVIARHPAAIRIEARHRILGGAIDAARG
jgi:hypothetical protein